MQPDKLGELDELIAEQIRQTKVAATQANAAIGELYDLLNVSFESDDYDEQLEIKSAMTYCQGMLHGCVLALTDAHNAWRRDTVNIGRVHWYEP